jgi:hypothetical protein
MMIEAALAYAVRGIPLFPVWWAVDGHCACPTGGECTSPAKHPLTPHGLKDASTDPDVVRGWWERWADANIGIPTGIAFDALDIDGDEGIDTASALIGGGDAEIPFGAVVWTPHGLHIYVQPTGMRNRARFLDGLDWRGPGGYVVAPPSIGVNGVAYRFWSGYDLEHDRALPGLSLDEITIDPAPGWLVELLTRERPVTAAPRPVHPFARFRHAPGYGDAALAAECARVVTAAVGCRNDTLNRSAFALGQLVATDQLDVERVFSHLLGAALVAGLGDSEARGTIKSGLGRGLDQPRIR